MPGHINILIYSICRSSSLALRNIARVMKYSLMSRNARDDKNGRFGERAPQLTMLAKLAILANFVKLVMSSIGIDSSWVNISDFGEFDKIGNFGDPLPISSN